MPGWLKVLLIIAGVGVLLIALAVVGGVFWFKSNMSGWAEAAKRSAAEGTTFGAGKPSADCLTEAAARLRAKNSFNDELGHKFFLRACLDAARQPDGFCDAVPKRDELI